VRRSTLSTKAQESVTVSPDGSQNNYANEYGWVDTTNTETVVALNTITPSSTDPNTVNANFDKWIILQDPQSNIVTSLNNGEMVIEVEISGLNLKVTQGWSVSALAFYTAPPQPSQAQLTCKETAAGVERMIAFGVPGPRFTVAEWANVEKSLEKCVAEGYLTQAFVNNLIGDYLRYAEGRNQPPPGRPPRL
jgi:hypothetical protein